jgi:hypothetical protein
VTSLQPRIQVVIGGRPPIRLAIEITCGLEIKGIVLKIQGAAMIRTGN